MKISPFTNLAIPIKQFNHLAAAGLLLAATVGAPAANITNLYAFATTGTNAPYTNSTGYEVWGRLLLWSNALYGTTVGGGAKGQGTVFRLNTDGSGFTNLHAFSGNDGANPYTGLILINNALFGTTVSGGSGGYGTVFALNADGSGFTNFYNFSYFDGAAPYGLSTAGGVLYGTTASGGTNGKGTVFRVNTDGTGFTNLHSFTILSANTNSDGAIPHGDVAMAGNVLYGTTWVGGATGNGTLFCLNTDGTGFTNLHNFTASVFDGTTDTYTNADGANPFSGPTLVDGVLYGTTSEGGLGRGTVFRVNTDGTDFTNVYVFSDSEGAGPQGSLLAVNDMLYGTTQGGGEEGLGTAFQMTTNGTDFGDLVDFSSSLGFSPQAGLILSGKLVYGTTEVGGSNGGGTVFALQLPPPNLTIQLSGAQVVLSWGNPAFSLQTATLLNGTFTNLPGATSPYTNNPDLQQQFFRLQ